MALDFDLVAHRRVGYYVWKVILPLSMIVVMSWSVFWMDPNNLGPQTGIAATSMLTLIAFLFALGNILPRISYLTTMDRFVMGSSALVFAALLEAIGSGYLASHGRAATAVRIERQCRWLFPTVFIGLIIAELVVRRPDAPTWPS